MRITHIDHYNIRIKVSDLKTLRDFYVNVIGLTEGARPNFKFPGCWLYGGAEAAILHLAATLPESASDMAPDKPTGQFDHISLKASDQVSARARLKAAGVPFDERPVPGWRLNQIFFTDPAGLKVELTFDMEREEHIVRPGAERAWSARSLPSSSFQRATMNDASLRRAKTSLLDVAYLESGPESGFPLILIHGWPDDALTWNRVAPRLAEAGFRVICPYLRGCGPTRFLHAATTRSGQLVALGQDLVEFAAALKLERYAVIGHDWGARAAYIASGLDAARISHCVGVSVGYGTNSLGQKLSMAQLQNYWYHWLMATERGRQVMREDRVNFTRHIWDIWMPFWKPEESEFLASAQSFDNPDWAEIVLHSYTVRWGHAAPHADYAALEKRFDPAPQLSVHTLTLHGAQDPVNPPITSQNKEGFFTGRYARKLIEQCGHFPQREHAGQVADEIIAWMRA